MPEQELNPAATKFISSLVRSLQILCNGQVEFNETIELVGHINVKIDHKYKFDYIVDEHVSKEGEDSSTTFLSNSYHSCRPTKQTNKKSDPSALEQDLIFSGIPHNTQRRGKQMKNMHEMIEKHCDNSSLDRENEAQNYSVSVEPRDKQYNEHNQMVVKLEGGEDSNDCMVLPASPVDYEGEGNRTETFPVPGTSSSFNDSPGNQTIHTRKRRKVNNQSVDYNNLYMSVERTPNSSNGQRKDNTELQNKNQAALTMHPSFLSQSTPCEVMSNENLIEKEMPFGIPLHSTANKSENKNELQVENKKSESNVQMTTTSITSNASHTIHDLKQLIIKLAALCDLPSIQDEIMLYPSRCIVGPSEEDIRLAKKKFLEVVDKEKIKKIKEVLKMKKSKLKKQRLKALLTESGLTNEQLLLLAQDANIRKKRINWKPTPEAQGKEILLKEHKKALRIKTQERHQKLLEMAEMLKRNQVNDPGITVVSKNGGKKCILHKSYISVVSHNTQQLSIENIDEVAEILTGKTRKATLVQQSCQDKSKEQIKVEYTRRVCLKKKMKQIVGKMLAEISDAGFRVVVTSTIGSEVGSHSAELSVIPLKVDDFWPETKQSDVKPELTEDEYAKQLEREQIIEKQKANEEKMKELEIKLLRILTGAEEIFVPTRKRYSPGEARPTDAERMKEYRKKLKQDPEKYQVYRQKRAMSKRRRRLGEYAAKVRVTNAGSSVSVIPTAPVTEEPCGSQSMGALVSMTQPVGNVSMHCSQVYEHPSSHQATASVVNVHHTTQYVGQVSGIHPSHQHQQSITYGNEMDIVELIAATHNVQNQHFG